MKAFVVLVVLASVACVGREPTREEPTHDDESASSAELDAQHVCSPENPAPGSRIGCVGEDGSCLTYECCEVYGCGPDGDACDCCGFDDAPLEEC